MIYDEHYIPEVEMKAILLKSATTDHTASVYRYNLIVCDCL